MNPRVRRDAPRAPWRAAVILALAVAFTLGGVALAVNASAAPGATFYPANGDEHNGFTPLSRHVLVTGDGTVAYIRADWNGDATWDDNATGSEAQWHHVYTQAGVYNGVLAACTAAHVCTISTFTVNAWPGENPACIEDCDSGNAAGEIGTDYEAERAVQWFIAAFLLVGFLGMLWLTRGR